jgi:LmbE family N-acetylglucosaminyl deacetylase
LEHSRSKDRKILLVSDGVSTEFNDFHFRLSEEFAEERIPLFILGFNHERNPALCEPLIKLAQYTGGAFFTFNQVEELKHEILQPWKLHEARSGKPFYPVLLAGAGGSVIPEARKESRINYNYFWLLLALLFLALAVFFRYRTAKEKKKWEQNRPVPRIFLHLVLQDARGRLKKFRTSKSPLRIGNTGKYDMRLEGVKGKVMFTYTWDAGGADFSSGQSFLLNGVAVKRKRLKKGDRLKFGGARLIYNGLEAESIKAPDFKDYSFYPLSAGVFSFILFVLLLSVQNIQAPQKTALLEEAFHEEAFPEEEASQEKEAAEEKEESTESIPVVTRAEEKLKPIIKKTEPREETGSSTAAGKTAKKSKSVQPSVEKAPAMDSEVALKREKAYTGPFVIRRKAVIRKNPLRMVAPGEEIPYFKADILFIHAHPDDESLDFGGLMARALSSGRKSVTVLFTDGEAGIDQFPNRLTEGIYLAEDLTGNSLSAVRIQEAASALSILGSSLYIRLGFENFPYNSSRDVLPVDEVLAEWGGREALGVMLKALIRGFDPDIVVSSDSNPDAYEHFEHKAVGQITMETLLELQEEGFDAVKGYLVSVDPFQKNLYDDLVHLDLMRIHPENGLSYREIQMAALKEHHTQGDASMIGVELLPNFRWEQYLKIFWSLDMSLEEYVL